MYLCQHFKVVRRRANALIAFDSVPKRGFHDSNSTTQPEYSFLVARLRVSLQLLIS
jgi:hypothetical protein